MKGTTRSYDCLLLGTGGAGGAALYHLARRGARVLGIDRFPPGHDRGSSHGDTRIIRQAYFEHPDYVPLLLRAYELWKALEEERGRKLYHPVGLLQVGPPGGVVIPGVLESARRHILPVDRLEPGEAEARFPGFRVPPGMLGVFEKRAGYLLVEECVLAHIELALASGAELRVGETVRSWRADGCGVVVETEAARYRGERLIITAGPWAGEFLRELGVSLEVRRKPLFWFRAGSSAYRADGGAPAFLYETPSGVFYGFPEIDRFGLKAAEHTGGAPVTDPLAVDRALDPEDERRLSDFLAVHLPGVTSECLKHVVCMYTMTRDEHFIVDRHPEHSQVVFAAGLSGHGFKFTAILGEILAALALDGRTEAPIGFLRWDRPGLGSSNR
jgi:sarcosine oxidase